MSALAGELQWLTLMDTAVKTMGGRLLNESCYLTSWKLWNKFKSYNCWLDLTKLPEHDLARFKNIAAWKKTVPVKEKLWTL